MKRIFALRSVAQIHREVATYVIQLAGCEPVPSMRVKITEDMSDGTFTAFGELMPRPISGKHTPVSRVADGPSAEDALLNYLETFEEQLAELKATLNRRLTDEDFVRRSPLDF